MDRDAARGLLDRVTLFKGLGSTELDQVLECACWRELPNGAILVRQGEDARELHLVAGGRFKVGTAAPQGSVLIRFMEPGDLIGCAAVFRQIPYPATATAVTDSSVLSWTAERIGEVIRRHPEVAGNALDIVGERTEEMLQRLREIATEGVEQRIARAILRLVAQLRAQPGRGAELRLDVSRRDLAELAGVSLYTVSRTLSGWEPQGIVKGGRQRITIRNPDRLKAIAQGLQPS
jgi:CRP-like cAMP-binding protein